jgi:chromosome segregation ATPase
MRLHQSITERKRKEMSIRIRQTVGLFICMTSGVVAQSTPKIGDRVTEADGVTALLKIASQQEADIKRRIQDMDVGSKQAAASEAKRRLTDTDTEVNTIMAQLGAAIRNSELAFTNYSEALDELAKARAVPTETRQKMESELASVEKQVRHLDELLTELNRVRAAARSVESVKQAIGDSEHLLGIVQPSGNSEPLSDAKKKKDIGAKPERRE